MSNLNNQSTAIPKFDRERPKLFWAVTSAVWAIVGIFLTILLIRVFSTDEEASIALQVSAGILVLYGIVSLRIVSVNRQAAVLLFGIPVLNIGPGPKLIPVFVFSLLTYPRNVLQKQFPGNPEEVFKRDDKEELPPGMVRPLRLTTGKPEKVDKLDPLSIQMTINFLYYIRYQVSDPILFTIKFGGEQEFLDQVRDTADKVLTREVSKCKGVSQLVKKLSGTASEPGIMENLQTEIDRITDDGGVTIVESGLNAPDLSHELASAIRDIGVERAKAQGERVRIEQVGIANAFAAKELIDKTDKVLSKAGAAAQAAYVGEKVLKDANATVLGTEGLTQLIGLGGILAGNLKKDEGQ